MGKGQPVGVECLPADVRHIRIVQVVSNERIAQILHVDPDLVGAAGFQPQFYKAVGSVVPQRLVVCDCLLPLFKIHHPLDDGGALTG